MLLYLVHKLSLLIFTLIVALASASNVRAQSTDTLTPNVTYIYGGIGGFIPMRDSYRINYSTKLAGLPLELIAGVLMPISQSVQVPLTVRYVRREANFVSSTHISVLSFEPGARFFLERRRNADVRLFGGIDALIAQASVQGEYESTADGAAITPATASKTYMNYGLAFDIGATYELASMSALDAIVHIASYFGSPIANGGIGNIGGVSISAVYRVGF